MTDQEITRQLAEKVMGWTYWSGEKDYDGPPGVTIFTDWSLEIPINGVDVYADGSDNLTSSFDPLNKIADAWLVVEKMAEHGFLWEGYRSAERDYNNSAFYCSYGPCFRHNHMDDRRGHGTEVTGMDSMYKAIALSALGALGVAVPIPCRICGEVHQMGRVNCETAILRG
jgi:hypothetical protein